MRSELLFSFVVAMVVTMALVPALMRASRWLGMLDHPEPRKVHAGVVPRVGGLAMLAGLLVALLAVPSFSRPMLGILSGILIVAVEGAWDDVRPIGYIEKFVAQFAAAICVVAIGGLEIRELVLFGDVTLPSWFSVPVTVLVIVALTNAINLADGLDGLAGGVSFFCSAALAVFAYLSGNAVALVLAAALCGAILGFLRFNTHPAVVFMGDGGSQLLGLAVASLAILVTQSETGSISATTPLFLLAIPILDTLFVMATRIRQGRSPFSADRNHLHHRLLALGFNQAEAVALIYAAQAALFILAYLLRFESDITNLLVFAALGAVLLASIAGRGSPMIATLRKSSAQRWFPFAGLRDLRPQLHDAALIILRASLVFYCVLAAITLSVTPSNVVWLLAGLFAVMLLLWLQPVARRLPAAEKGATYVFAATLAYLFANGEGWATEIRLLETAVVISIAVSTAAVLKFSSSSTFRLNPMDFLVLFTAIVIPSLPDAIWSSTSLAALTVRWVVLLYALEVVLSRAEGPARVIQRITATLIIGVLMVKGLVALPLAPAV